MTGISSYLVAENLDFSIDEFSFIFIWDKYGFERNCIRL